jgi:hypothetical protein
MAFTVSLNAAPLPAPAHAEVEALLLNLEKSGCQFNRNGSWYSGADARAHLQQKLDYLEGKGLVQTSEQFIEKGASSSSMSGKAYLVRCGTAAPVESRRWLETQLSAQRAAAKAAPPGSK